MAKPITPGCVCVVVGIDDEFAPNNGRTVIAVSRDTPNRWWIRPLACLCLVRFRCGGPLHWSDAESSMQTRYLRRLDDDPDAAGSRVAEREIEHA